MIGKLIKYSLAIGVVIGVIELRPFVPNVSFAVFTIMTILFGVALALDDNISIERKEN